MNNNKEENQISSLTNIIRSINLYEKHPYENKSVFKKKQILNTISLNPKIPLYTFRNTIKIGCKTEFSNKELSFDYNRILAIKNRSLLNALIFLFSVFAIINCGVNLIYSIVRKETTDQSILFSVFAPFVVLFTNFGIYFLLKKFIYRDDKFEKWLIYQNYSAIFFCFFCTLGELAILGLISKNEWFHNSNIKYFWGYLLYPFLFISFLKLLRNLIVKVLVFWITQSIISVYILLLDTGLEFYDYITLYAYSIVYFLFGTLVLYINELESKENLEFFANFKKANNDWQKLADAMPHSVILLCPSSHELLFCNDCGNQIFDNSFSKNENKIDQLSHSLGQLRKIKVSSQNITQNLEEMLKKNEDKCGNPAFTIETEDKQNCVLPNFGTLAEILKHANDHSNLYSENDTIIYATKSKVQINQKYVGFSECNERNFTVKIKFITYENKLSVLLILEDCAYVEVISDLNETSKFKNKLLSSFSHELKTPLNGAIPILESLEKETQLELQVLKLLRVSIASLKILQTVLDDIIDYALINSGELQLNCTEINLMELMNDLACVISIQTQEKFIKINQCFDPNIPKSFFTDYKRLRQILMSILRNSVKFSLKSGEITIKISMDSSFPILIFTIEDLGIGISTSKLQIIQKLLNDLKNHEKMANSCMEEFNLGLIIAQKIALILGPFDGTGGIQISSAGIGKGTRVEFRIEDKMKFSLSEGDYSTFNHIKSHIQISKSLKKTWMPQAKRMNWIRKLEMIKFENSVFGSKSLKSIELEEDQICVNDLEHTNDIGNLVQRFNFQTNSLTINILNERPFPIFCCEPILVVDDDPFNLLSAEVILKKIGFKIQKAFDGMEAIEKVIEKFKEKCNPSCQGFKLILMDYNMPVMGGIEATKKLIEMMNAGEINKIPIVACTAFGAKEDLINCFEAGMVDYISKPIQRAILEKVIKLWVK